ncbi:MAG TPA: DnaJ domain-containing protein [Stellaceae bacterium]|nr:DnaJ domain-containing protein [Stellaceae bacterium]
MPYVALGLLALLAVYVLGRLFLAANPATLAGGLRWALGILAGIAVVFLLATDRLAPALGLLGGALTVALRGHALWSHFRAASGPQPGKVSEVETDYLRMTLDHDTGTMSGIIRRGRYQGRDLSELATADLVALWREWRAEDEASARLLATYLDRAAPGWREADTTEGAAGPQAARSGAMTREEAYEILGLAPGASAEEVKAAHRRLMMKLHPDQGGSTYLAARVNHARDLLLGG